MSSFSVTPIAQLSDALRLAQLLAVSYYSNPRNLEHPWYSFWLLVAIQLVEGHNNMAIFPQFYVWLEKNKENVTSKPPKVPTIKSPPSARSPAATTAPQDSDTFRVARSRTMAAQFMHPSSENPTAVATTAQASEIARVTRSHTMVAQSTHPSRKNTPIEGLPALNEPSEGAVEHEPPSPTETVGAANPVLRLPDFAIVHVSGETTNSITGSGSPLPKVKKGALQVRLLIENKRFISRRILLDQEKVRVMMFGLFKEAIEDITQQAACVFSQPMYDSTKEIVAIVTCGDYWRHTIFTRETIDQSVMDLMNTGDGTYQETDANSIWTIPMKIQDRSSIDILQKVFNKVCGK